MPGVNGRPPKHGPEFRFTSKTGATPDDVDRFRHAFLRRFDLEHTFRFAKKTPRLDHPETPYS